jgi:4-hydroxybenzoate polyprenyltransferase
MPYLRLPHATPILAVMGASAALIGVMAPCPADWSAISLLLLSLLGGQVAVGVVNELADAEMDAAAGRNKPIPRGDVSRSAAVWMLVAGLTLFVATAPFLGPLALALAAAGNGLGIAYSLWFKRTRFAWLPYFLALPLLPMWLAVGLDVFDAELLALYPLGAAASLAVYLAQSAPDAEADRASGLFTLATRLGERGSLALAWLLLLASCLAMATVGRDAALAIAAALAGAVLVAANVTVFLLEARRGLMLAFPCVAGASALLGLAWVARTVG